MKTANVSGQIVTIGSYVSFKSDVEQTGKIINIRGRELTLQDVDGFEGGYIGGDTVTIESAEDCWID